MKKIITYITFAFLTGSAISITTPIIAGSCSNHNFKNEQKECSKEDIKCTSKETKNYKSGKTLN